MYTSKTTTQHWLHHTRGQRKIPHTHTPQRTKFEEHTHSPYIFILLIFCYLCLKRVITAPARTVSGIVLLPFWRILKRSPGVIIGEVDYCTRPLHTDEYVSSKTWGLRAEWWVNFPPETPRRFRFLMGFSV